MEFLVVIAIMAILMALVLIGLTNARQQGRDEKKISTVQAITIGLAQFHDLCGEYPEKIDDTVHQCLGEQTIEQFIPETKGLDFNGNSSPYGYAALEMAGVGNQKSYCTAYHIWVKLENNQNGYAAKSSRANSQQSSIFNLCRGSDSGFNAENALDVFDIFKGAEL